MATNLALLDVSFVKDECPSIESMGISDSKIQRQVNYVDATYGQCLSESYGDEEGSVLASHAICFKLMDTVGGSFPIKSETAANGSSTTYDTRLIQQDSRNFIDKYDTKFCLTEFINPIIFVGTLNGGATREEISDSRGSYSRRGTY